MLRAGAAKPAVREPPQSKLDEERAGGRALGCAFCRRPITTSAAAIEFGGSHSHVFSNPDGISFRVGCFSDAAGLVKHGPSSSYWTWFPGYSWQVELCAGCREQLGWLYLSREHRFHGLILDNLVEIEEQ